MGVLLGGVEGAKASESSDYGMGGGAKSSWQDGTPGTEGWGGP